MSLYRILRPHVLVLYFDDPRSSLKKTCLFLYVKFKTILVCTCDFWPQTCVHRDVFISPNTFGVFLIWVWITWILASQIPWELSYSTLHYLFGVLYKEPLDNLKEGELKSKETIVHCCLNFAYTWVYITLSIGARSVLPNISFYLWYFYWDMEVWSGGGRGGGLGFFGS